MISNSKLKVFCLLSAFGIFAFLNGTINCFAQEDEESKGIQSVELMQKRPPAKSFSNTSSGSISRPPKRNSAAAVKPKRPIYRRVVSKSRSAKPAKPASKEMMNALLGLTFWKLRPAEKTDAAKEMIEETVGGKVQSTEYTLERMDSDIPLAEGERIRISLESLSHSGYLYVVNRELYSDGTYSAPKLIYPTLKTQNRNTMVSAGKIIFIPESASAAFRIRSNQGEKKQVAEVLTVIVSPKILFNDTMLSGKAIEIPTDQLSGWLKQWEVNTTLFEQEGGAGQTITPIEQTAGHDAAKELVEQSATILTQNDPLPQSVYRSKVKRGDPLLVNISLKFASN